MTHLFPRILCWPSSDPVQEKHVIVRESKQLTDLSFSARINVPLASKEFHEVITVNFPASLNATNDYIVASTVSMIAFRLFESTILLPDLC